MEAEMKLRRLQIEGYKNIRSCDIEFTQSPLINAVIGSNGSGKSNLIEAILSILVGCNQVCEKWLKDRKGHNLSADDRTHYQKVVVALSETIHLMAEIDVVIEKHGGWPIK